MTPKQEAFCLAYIEIGNASEAYRRAGYSSKMSAKTVNEAASRLLADSKIVARVRELKAAHVERHNVTVDDIRKMLLEDRDFARKLETASAAVSATMGLAKLYGHLTDKIEHSGIQGRELSDEDRAVRLASLTAAIMKQHPGKFAEAESDEL